MELSIVEELSVISEEDSSEDSTLLEDSSMLLELLSSMEEDALLEETTSLLEETLEADSPQDASKIANKVEMAKGKMRLLFMLKIIIPNKSRKKGFINDIPFITVFINHLTKKIKLLLE